MTPRKSEGRRGKKRSGLALASETRGRGRGGGEREEDNRKYFPARPYPHVRRIRSTFLHIPPPRHFAVGRCNAKEANDPRPGGGRGGGGGGEDETGEEHVSTGGGRGGGGGGGGRRRSMVDQSRSKNIVTRSRK